MASGIAASPIRSCTFQPSSARRQTSTWRSPFAISRICPTEAIRR